MNINLSLDVKWYQWIFGAISFLLAVLLVHESFATFAESQPQALGTYLLLIGIPLLVALYLTFGLRWTINQTRKNKQ